VKTYRVIFQADARNEALRAAEYIAKNAPLNAIRWYEGLEEAVESLSFMPHRCGIAPETRYLGAEYRHYIYKSHRVIFRIDEKERTVRIIHVRHGARRAVGEPADSSDLG
jgi:plasmid stabilization system protein ParE